jgi:ParB family chromosome partitioning protein
LEEHPGNVRADLTVSAEFVASIKTEGIRVPLLVTTAETPDTYRVIDGHKRLAGARKAGLDHVPYTLDAARAEDPAGQYLDMLITSRHKTPLSAIEEAAALFAAHEAGASKARLAKAYGRRADVTAALKAAELPTSTRATVAHGTYAWTLDELATLHEFADDEEATTRLVTAAEDHSFGYQVERERIERTERQRRDEVRARLIAHGVRVHDAQPEGALPLHRLRNSDGDVLNQHNHRECPGQSAYLVEQWNAAPRPMYLCDDPAGHGHVDAYDTPAGHAMQERYASLKTTRAAKRRLVIQGNKDARAAETNRRKWLTTLLARTSLDRDHIDVILRWTAETYLTLPTPVRKGANNAQVRELRSELLGLTDEPQAWSEHTAKANRCRLALLTLAPLAASFEKAFTVDTWRMDIGAFTVADRTDARYWLAFCESLGHTLSPVERAILRDEAYTPAGLSKADDNSPTEQDENTSESG